MLPQHHTELERACYALLAATYSDDSRALGERWGELEHLVEAHFGVEEELLLPAFERIAPREVATIRAEHARLRESLGQLGLEVELHVVRAATVAALVARLRAHALREDASLYPWAALLPSTLLAELSTRLALPRPAEHARS